VVVAAVASAPNGKVQRYEVSTSQSDMLIGISGFGGLHVASTSWQVYQF
jgi:hypothetical protein